MTVREPPIFPAALRRDVLLLIAIKLLLLFLLYRIFFAPHEIPALGGDQVARHLLGP